jgi:hypothetical protein
MITFLFWNLKKKPLAPRVRNLVAAHSVDLVILAECRIPSTTVESELDATGKGPFTLVSGSGSELHLYTRLPTVRWQALYADPLEAWLTFRVQIGRRPALLLFVAHLPSKLRAKDMDQLLAATQLGASIKAIEAQQGHERTLVVGDLNVNPFENPVAWAGALHAVMSRDLITRMRGEREIRATEYQFFYNPMWSVLGDRTPGPPGTYYRASSESVNYFWNTYDQVLLRPGLMGDLRDVIVPTTDGVSGLLTRNGLPDSTAGSDHLPLVFTLDW